MLTRHTVVFKPLVNKVKEYIRNIYDQMKDLDLNMLIFLIRVATTTCREILIKNKEVINCIISVWKA